MNLSVALAAYNGEKYIINQLKSIIKQLDANDQIIISDDSSTDTTPQIINSIISNINDTRINVCQNPKKGIISNFENAIRHSTGDIILLCDQDDVWCDDKVSTIKRYFQDPGIDLIVSDAYVTDENLNVVENSFYKLMNSGPGFWKNFAKNTYHGCCMAFRSKLKDIILPFPANIPMHDSWIGLLAELNGKAKFIPEKLVYYRRHGENASTLKRTSIVQALTWRKNLALELFKRQIAISQF